MFAPLQIGSPIRGSTIAQLRIDQALGGNACFLREGLEVLDHIITQSDRYLHLQSVGVCGVVVYPHGEIETAGWSEITLLAERDATLTAAKTGVDISDSANSNTQCRFLTNARITARICQE